MFPFKLKRNFKKISILLVVSYIVLCITSGGLHSFDKRAYHGHGLEVYGTSNGKIENQVHHNQAMENSASLCFNDHSADKCDICQWLKSTPSKVQFVEKRTSLFQDCSKLCVIVLAAYDFLNIHTKSPRSPPFSIS